MSKNILFRADLDVPLKNGLVANNYRLQCLLPTLKETLKSAHKLLIIGHQGRPACRQARPACRQARPACRGGPTQTNTKNSLLPIKKELESLIHQPISFIPSLKGVGEWQKNTGQVAMLENLRFFKGENGLSREFALEISQGSNLYIYEAFAHYRPSSSLQIIPEILPTTTGKRFNFEAKTLTKTLVNPKKPNLLILSGTKEDKLKIVENLKDNFNSIIIGGHLALLQLPAHLKGLSNIKTTTLTPNGLDIDTNAITLIKNHISNSQTIVLNGPLGKFEDGLNTKGTKEVLKALKNSPAFIILGGGDTLNAIKSLGFKYEDFSFVSTGGGAMINFLTTHTHPLLERVRP